MGVCTFGRYTGLPQKKPGTVVSYGLSFSGFAMHLSLIVPRNSGNRANLENDSP